MSERRRVLALASVAALVAGTARAQQGRGFETTAVGSVRELLEANPDAAARLAIVAGYDAPGDGGGGLFLWQPNALAPTDGGLVFAPKNRAEKGRWRRMHDGPIDVRMFGAKGDGKTDDTEAIQAAIDAAAGAEVRIPGGTWLVTRTLHYVSRPGRHSAGLKLMGEGVASTILDCRVKEGPALRIAQAEGYRFGLLGMIRDLEIRGSNASGGRDQHGIVVSGAWMYRLDRVTIGGFRGTALMAPMVEDRSGTFADVEMSAGSATVRRAGGGFRDIVVGSGDNIVSDALAEGTRIDRLVDDRTLRLTKPATRDAKATVRIWGNNPDGQQSIIAAHDCRFIFNGEWGISSNAASGIALRLRDCHVTANSGGGIRTSGFLDMEGGACMANGTDDGKGIGILLEGPDRRPSELSRIESVEIDSNKEVSLWLKRTRFVRVSRCRFNAHEVEKVGKQFPAVSIRIGDGEGSLVHTIELSKNEIRVDGHHMWPHTGIQIPDGANVDDVVIRDTLFWGGWSDDTHVRYQIGRLADRNAAVRFEDRGVPTPGLPVPSTYIAQLSTEQGQFLTLPPAETMIVDFRSVHSTLPKPASVWRMTRVTDLATDAGGRQATIGGTSKLLRGMPLLMAGKSSQDGLVYARIEEVGQDRRLLLDRESDAARGAAVAGGIVCPYEGYFAVDVVLDIAVKGDARPVAAVLLVDGRPFRTETSIVHDLGTPQTLRLSALERWPLGTAFHVGLRNSAGTASLYSGALTVRLLR